MKKVIIALLLLSIASCVVKKQSHKEPKVDTTPKYIPMSNSILWQVSGPDLSKPSYIFGTMHSICADKYIWTPKLQSIFDSSETLVLELDLTDISSQLEMAKIIMLEGDTTLSDFLTEAEYKAVNDFIDKRSISNLLMFNKMRPSYTSAILSTQAFQCADQESYEMNLMSMAQNDGKNIIGLETMEQQLSLFEKMDDQKSAKDIYNFVSNFDSAVNKLNSLMAMYINQDIESLHKLVEKDDVYGTYTHDLLHKRNIDWSSKLPVLMKDNALFVAVGAAHLGGENGIINLLKSKGYILKPIIIK